MQKQRCGGGERPQTGGARHPASLPVRVAEERDLGRLRGEVWSRVALIDDIPPRRGLGVRRVHEGEVRRFKGPWQTAEGTAIGGRDLPPVGFRALRGLRTEFPRERIVGGDVLVVIPAEARDAAPPEQREALRRVRPVAGDVAEADDVVHAAAVECSEHGKQRLEISVEVADHRETWTARDPSHAPAHHRGGRVGFGFLHAG